MSPPPVCYEVPGGMHHKHSCPILLFLSSPSTKTELDKLEAEHLALTQTIANKNKLFNKVVDFLPNVVPRLNCGQVT